VALPDGTTATIESDDEHNGADDDEAYWRRRNIDIFQMFVNLVDVGKGEGPGNQHSQTTQLQQQTKTLII
jgi:hypothetical protein